MRPRTLPSMSRPAASIDVGKSDLFGDRIEHCRIQVVGEALPGGQPRLLGRHHAVDAQQGNTAQDERGDPGRKIHALGETAGGNRSAIAGLGARVRQGVAADGVDNPRPTFLLHGLALFGELRAIQDRAGAELLEVLGLRRLPRDGGDLEPGLGQQRDRDAADAAGGTGHQDLALIGAHPVGEQGVDAEARRIARGADRHRLLGGEARRQRHQPVAVEAGALGEAAPMGFTHSPTVEHDAVALLPIRVCAFGDDSRKVDAGHHRKLAHHRRFAGDGEAVLEVQRRVLHVDADVAVGELRLLQAGQTNRLAVVVLVDQYCRKHVLHIPFNGDFGALTPAQRP